MVGEVRELQEDQDEPGVVVHTVIPALRSLKHDNLEFEASLGYIERPCLKKPRRPRWLEKGE
jgi:hypothetical protein